MQDFENFKKLLNDQYNWPASYTFKFIVPESKLKKLKSILGSGFELLERPSRSGKYVSCVAKKKVSSSEEVVEVYKTVGTIDGAISL